GLYVKDPLLSAQFYQDILGMQTVGGTPDGTPDIGASAFLSSRPGEESHEIALFSRPQFRHVAFKVASLAELKRLYRLVLERELPIKLTFDHGASLAFYFDDPDGNMIEVYWPTGKHVKQPFLKPRSIRSPERGKFMNIAEKTVLVTGANRGIGEALVKEALSRGAKRGVAGTRGALANTDPRVSRHPRNHRH
ncbi:MAG TPA: VOC family protein, partial [Chthoniobacterales bacterium]|nr:VOC family protein [Chthoniobacterales bacterium]